MATIQIPYDNISQSVNIPDGLLGETVVPNQLLEHKDLSQLIETAIESVKILIKQDRQQSS